MTLTGVSRAADTMSRTAFLRAYGKAWQIGDAAQILAATAAGFIYEDPAFGTIARVDFPAYLEAFKARVAALRTSDGAAPAGLMTFSDFADTVAADEDTAWAWWRVPETTLQGGGMIKIGDDGIRLERMTYFAAPATATR